MAYRERTAQDDPGTPVTRIRPRPLMAPPGYPDFMTRRRYVTAGVAPLTGRAWSGRAPLTAVSAGSDGRTWLPATLGPAVDRYAWRSWSAMWEAAPGEYTVMAHAEDEVGPRPVDQPWNVGGMANNMVQRVEVVVRPPGRTTT